VTSELEAAAAGRGAAGTDPVVRLVQQAEVLDKLRRWEEADELLGRALFQSGDPVAVEAWWPTERRLLAELSGGQPSGSGVGGPASALEDMRTGPGPG
jgi:hypothetical protein